jgi:hypothetical protein
VRTVWIATFLAIIVFGGAFAYSHLHLMKLRRFCESIPLKSTDIQLRETAYQQGFIPSMEPFAQLRIEPGVWHPSGASCRVFLNNSRTVEYKKWQED